MPARFLKNVSIVMIVFMTFTFQLATSNAASRIKDIADFEGIRDNQLVGYGLIVGLNGTGDTLQNAPFTRQSLIAMLERMGVNTRENINNLKTANIAAVMVTANLAPFARSGSRLDVNVNSIGDASSLQGGTLLFTPLRGADDEVYAVAQGPLAVGGFTARGDATEVTQNTPTTGRVANGGIIEREIPFESAQMTDFNISLRNPDLTTSRRMAEAINRHLGTSVAQSLDPATVSVIVPPRYSDEPFSLLGEIEQLRVQTDQIARVIIEESTGIIVIGKDVRVDTVAIAQGNLTVSITETPEVSQPLPFAPGGETTIIPRTNIDVQDDSDKRLTTVPGTVSLEELVNGLNSLGVGPRDMISILQAIKAAGALQAELRVI